MQHELISLSFQAPTSSIDLNSNYDKTYKVTPMIKLLWTTQIALLIHSTFWVSEGGRYIVQKKVFVQGSVQGYIIQCETTCENIVSRYQTLVSSPPPPETLFLHRPLKTQINNCACSERGSPVIMHLVNLLHVTTIIIHSKYLPNSDWLKAHISLTITSYWWPNLEEVCVY